MIYRVESEVRVDTVFNGVKLNEINGEVESPKGDNRSVLGGPMLVGRLFNLAGTERTRRPL